MSKFTNAIKGMSKLKKVMTGMWLGVAATLIALVAVLIAFGDKVGEKRDVAGQNPYTISQTVNGATDSKKLDAKYVDVINDNKNIDVISALNLHAGASLVQDKAAALLKYAGLTTTTGVVFYSTDRSSTSITRYSNYQPATTGKTPTPASVDTATFALSVNDAAKVFTDGAKNKSNAVAAIGTVFALTLVGAIGVTVAESIYRKRGAK